MVNNNLETINRPKYNITLITKSRVTITFYTEIVLVRIKNPERNQYRTAKYC